jgi:hypothetical protein
MVKRSEKARFFPGAHVFPGNLYPEFYLFVGGILEPDDSLSHWKSVFPKTQNMHLDPFDKTSDSTTKFSCC